MRASDLVADRLADERFEASVEVLAERALASGTTAGLAPVALRAMLRDRHQSEAFKLLAADLEHSGTVTLSAKMLADILEPAERHEPSPTLTYRYAEHRRQSRHRDLPSRPLARPVFERCLAAARAALKEK